MDNYNLIEHNTEDSAWQQLSQPVYADVNNNPAPRDDNETPTAQKKRYIVFSPIISFQLIVCLCFITLLYFGRLLMPSLFLTVMEAYNKEINTSMYFSGNFTDLDFSELFVATNDEV